MRQILIGLLVLSLLISSANALDVYGYVQDTTGAFISGALVELFNQTGTFMANATTGSTGFYNISINITTTGIYVLNYSHINYLPYSQGAVLLVAGQNKEVNTTLGPPVVGTMNGLIFDVNNLTGIAGATVLIQGPGVYVVTTNSTGYYTVNVAPGTYSINASAAGYYDNWATGSVTNGSTLTQNIGLTPIGDLIPPAISNVTVSSITQTSAMISWNTNENANSNVLYGTSPGSLGSSQSSSTLAQAHSISLTGLSSGTTYYFNVTSADAAGNIGMSGIYNFTTQPAPPSPPSGGGSGTTGGGGGGSGGGPSGVGASIGTSAAKEIDFCQSNPSIQSLDSRDVVRFIYAGSDYYLGFGRVDGENATVNLVPKGLFMMKEGDERSFDLDEDDIADLVVAISDIQKTVVPSPSGGFNLIRYTIETSLKHTGDLQCPTRQQSFQQGSTQSQGNPVQAIAAGIKNGVLNIIGTITPAKKASPLVGSAITGGIVVAGLALFFILRRRN